MAKPDVTALEEAYVVEALRSSWISAKGPFVDRFEREFAAVLEVPHVVTVSSGTAALHLALLALDVGRGDEVIVPSLTYVATVNAIRYVGAVPVFVDVDPKTWSIDPALIGLAMSARTKAIIAVHLYGHPADMDAISVVASRYGVPVIEDAAQAHLARYRDRPVGSLGTIATFSFYANKVITAGEGGAVATGDGDLAARVRMLRGQGMDPDRRYYFPVIGYNYRLSNVACAILCAQLERQLELVERRRQIAARYAEQLRPRRGHHAAATRRLGHAGGLARLRPGRRRSLRHEPRRARRLARRPGY